MPLLDSAPRQAQSKNNEHIQAFCYDIVKTKQYKSSPAGSSADPFSGKTNKYAESPIVRIISDADLHFVFSAAGTAATTSHHFLPADTEIFCAVDSDYAFLRVINSGSVYVTEIY
jgi:hypothetical protein